MRTDHVAALAAITGAYRYTWSERSEKLHITPTSDIGSHTLATADSIALYIDARVDRGEGTLDQIEAAMAARREDVATGYEDKVWSALRGGE